MLSSKKRQNDVLKQNSQVRGFFIPGTAFNNKSNGSYPCFRKSQLLQNSA